MKADSAGSVSQSAVHRSLVDSLNDPSPSSLVSRSRCGACRVAE